jgi:hypothetical protein
MYYLSKLVVLFGADSATLKAWVFSNRKDKVMKKILSFTFVLVLVVSLFFAGSAKVVSAFFIEDSGPAVGSWVWTSASVPAVEIPQYLVTTPGPVWEDLLTNALVIDGAAMICHPFRGGQFGWVGEIRMLQDGVWVKLATTNEWSPTEEGTFRSCAFAPSAGTYALFGYYVKPDVVEEEIVRGDV